MEFNGLILLAALWFLLSLIGKAAGRKPPEGQRPMPRPREPMRPLPSPTGQDPTQREGSRLELVLRELQRSLEEAAGVPAPAPPRLPPEQPYDESRSLEQEPEIISLEEGAHRRREEGAHREARLRVDQDDDAAEIEIRRIQAAAARYSARTPGSRVIQETEIKPEPADHTAARGYTAKQLRDAVVWREILGRPASER